MAVLKIEIVAVDWYARQSPVPIVGLRQFAFGPQIRWNRTRLFSADPNIWSIIPQMNRLKHFRLGHVDGETIGTPPHESLVSAQPGDDRGDANDYNQRRTCDPDNRPAG